ncbi:hypothetical protein [Microvirga sp. 2TAF3]|uniref:hypothetical protein n=1 Tax=Microvirga sp. 2TAF3 TaxID=3233014 RepID=UPI003F9827CF
MSAKVRIKAGSIEFEYEGQTELSIDDIKELFSHIETLFSAPSILPNSTDTADATDDTQDTGSFSKTFNGTKLHVNSIAAKIDAKTGPDLAIAAAAYLQFIEGKESFSRRELLNTMQEAKKYYRVSMSKNLTKHIDSLIGSKFNQVGQDQYSLSSSEHNKLEAKLA